MKEEAMLARLAAQPLLIQECIVTPTVIRQEHWVIIRNPISGGYVRLHAELWAVVQEFDGSVSLQQWLQTHASVFGDRQLLSATLQLQRSGILQAPTEDLSLKSPMNSLLVRHNPLMVRVPLFNPATLLEHLCLASRCLSVRNLSVALVLAVATAVYAVAVNWPAVAQQWKEVSDGTLVWHFLLLYPFTKCLHELAHGCALRRLGGEVPEAGVSFIVLFPMPYVDATDAWSLQRVPRMLVSAAGMLMDLLVASIGVVLWLTLSSGVIADMAFSVALMGFVSVVLFNANPLLKFDGYYVLEDALDSPGLARRAMAYYRYLSKRHLLFMQRCSAPVLSSGEIPWLLSYGLLSTLYRFFIAAVISAYLINTFHELGVVLSLFTLIPLCITPILRFVHFLCRSNELVEQRIRTVSVVMVVVMMTSIFLFSVPLPSATRTQGVVWVAEQAEIYSAQGGQLDSILVRNGDAVSQGQAVMTLRSDDLDFEMEQKHSAVRLATLDVARHRYSDAGLALSAGIVLQQAQSELASTASQIEKLTIRAPASGRIALNAVQASIGSFLQQGDLLAYIVNDTERVIRAVVNQSSLGQVTGGVHSANVRLAPTIGVSQAARIVRQVPSGNHDLPSAALIDTGFGGFKVRSGTPEENVQTREKVFHLELVLAEAYQSVPMGTRAYVTLEHAREPLAQRWIRVSRQLLLKHLRV